jgi:hypothetical protein
MEHFNMMMPPTGGLSSIFYETSQKKRLTDPDLENKKQKRGLVNDLD